MRAALRGLAIAPLFLATAIAAAAPAPDSPFVWEIQGPHAKHCLVGTVHALPRSMPLPANIEYCYQRARVLAVEAIGITLMTEAEYVRALGRIAEPDAGGLRKRIGEPMYAQVAAMAKDLSLDVHQFDPFTPWFAAQMLGAFRAINSLARFDFGIDVQLYRRAGYDRKNIVALESDQAHDEVLTKMPLDASVQNLQQTLDEFAHGGSPTSVVAKWMTGDAKGLEAQVVDWREHYPAYHRRLLAERNENWIPKIRELINGSEPAIIAAGTAHFLGPGNVRELLARDRIAATALSTP